MKGSFLYPFLWNSDGFLSEAYLEHYFADAELKVLTEATTRQSLGRFVEAFGVKRELMQGAGSERVRQEWCDPVLFPLLGAEVPTGVEIVAEGRVIVAAGALMRKSGAGKRRVRYRGREASRHIVCLYWIVPWDASLDAVGMAGEDPGLTLVDVAHLTMSQSGVPWAVLTNGRQVRLLSRSTSHKPRCFLEVDLEAVAERAVEREAQRAYLFFLAFFSAVAFLEPDERGETRLDHVVRGSARCVAALERELRVNVREALSELGRGFLAHLRNHRKASASWRAAFIPGSPKAGFLESPELLAAVHEESIQFVYRLLSLFYAESRNRVMGDGGGLQGLCDRLAAGSAGWESGGKESARGAGLWKQIRSLFKAAGEASEGSLPRSDRRVRGVQRRSRRRQLRLGDDHLARVLDLLTHLRDPSGSAGDEGCRRICYRDLDVRYLGSIYEGILQYAPRIADQDLALLRHGSGGRVRERWVPLAQLSTVQKRQLERRRKTGSALDRLGGGGLRGVSVSGEIQQGGYFLVHAGDESLRKSSGSFYTPESVVQYMVESTLGPHLRGEHRPGYRRPIPLRSDEILELKFLDPAMGSGHFLVAATEYLARAYGQARIREGREVGGVLSDETFTAWKRRVAECCIYGVDINPRAVELAKLTLELFTMGSGRPRIFLDHHLKCGDSLLGAWMEDFDRLPLVARDGGKGKRRGNGEGLHRGGGNAFRLRIAGVVERLNRIRGRETVTGGDVRAKRALQRAIERIQRPLQAVADPWVEKVCSQKSGKLRARALGPPASVARALEEAGLRCFHWPLEFPEIWFDERGARLAEPGFSAVAGNPPYFAGRQEGGGGLNRVERDSVGSDTYLRFCLLACRRLLKQSASRCSMIVPDAVLNRSNAEAVRRCLLSEYPVSSIIHIGRVFSEATVANLVFVAAVGGRSSPLRVVRVPDGGRSDSVREGEASVCSRRFFSAQPRCEFLYLVQGGDRPPLRRMFGGPSVCRPREPFRTLADLLGAPDHVFRGEEIGKSTVRKWAGHRGMPFLVGGESVQPFAVRDAGLRVPVSALGKSPARYRSAKILVQKSAARFVAAYDAAGRWGFPQSVYGILMGRELGFYVCALLNSDALSRFLWKTATGYKFVQPQIEIEDIRRLPIYRPGGTVIDLAQGRALLKSAACPKAFLPSVIAALGEALHRVSEEGQRAELTVRLNELVSSVYGW